MKKRKINVEIMIIVALVALLAGYKILDATSYRFVEAKAVHYLCQKYDAKPEDFELVDYKRAQIYWDDYYIFFLTPKWIDFSFEFEYNDRSFIVNRFEGKFYDDYQLDDIEKWCTEWLQKNVDERIIGLQIESTDIYWYQMYSKNKSNKIIEKNETEDFLNVYSFNEMGVQCFIFYFYDESLNNRNYSEVGDEIILKLHNKLNLNDKIYINYTTSYMKAYLVKREDKEWTRRYITYDAYSNLRDNQ